MVAAHMRAEKHGIWSMFGKFDATYAKLSLKLSWTGTIFSSTNYDSRDLTQQHGVY